MSNPQTTICPARGGNPLTDAELKVVAEFISEMETKVVPEIVEILKKRAEWANESRRKLIW